MGDPRQREQNIIIKIWKTFQINVHYHPLHWTDSRSFEIKLKEIVALIDNLKNSGYTVSLVGVSAGASAAPNTFAMRKDVVNAVVCICGKINSPETISDNTYKKNPSFKESLALLSDSLRTLNHLDRKKILSLRPLYDGVVPISDTYIEGATNTIFPSIGHAISVAYADTIGSFQIARFIKTTNILRF